VAEGGAVGSSREEFQSCISEKEQKLPTYRMRCDEIYLLIVASGLHISSDPGDADALKASSYQGSFDGVLLLDRIRGTVSRLTCE
jgi:hypothetical protein